MEIPKDFRDSALRVMTPHILAAVTGAFALVGADLDVETGHVVAQAIATFVLGLILYLVGRARELRTGKPTLLLAKRPYPVDSELVDSRAVEIIELLDDLQSGPTVGNP